METLVRLRGHPPSTHQGVLHEAPHCCRTRHRPPTPRHDRLFHRIEDLLLRGAFRPLKEAGVALVNARLGEAENPGESFTKLAEAYETASAKITNSEVKASVDQVAADWRTVAEKAQALSEDPKNVDEEKIQDLQASFEQLNTHQTELFHTCGYKYCGPLTSADARRGGPMGRPLPQHLGLTPQPTRFVL